MLFNEQSEYFTTLNSQHKKVRYHKVRIFSNIKMP